MAKTTREVEKEFLSEKERQLAEKKVKISIPKDKLNNNGYVWVCVNGVEYYLVTGKTIEVPECVAEVWFDSYSRTMDAEQKMNENIEIK